MGKNVQLKNVNGIQCFPRTLAKNIIMSDGTTLEDYLYDLVNGEHIVFEPYHLPEATRYSLGGVKVGSGLRIDGNGVLSTELQGSTMQSYDMDIINSMLINETNVYDYSEE